MEKMYAFWRYDVTPYVLSGKVKQDLGNNNVTIEGCGGFVFNCICQVPLKKGLKLKKKFDRLERWHRWFTGKELSFIKGCVEKSLRFAILEDEKCNTSK